MMYSKAMKSFWESLFAGEKIVYESESLTISCGSEVANDYHGMILDPVAGKKLVILNSDLSQELGIGKLGVPDLDHLKEHLLKAGNSLHGADYLFYFPASEHEKLREQALPLNCRELGQADEALFAEFRQNVSAEDQDASLVELDDWMVFGSFHEERLVSAGSVYPWMGPSIADMGVLTLPEFRGRGHALNLVQAMSAAACARGLEPQFRCQLDNRASVLLAQACEMELFGTWDVIEGPAAQ